MRRIKLILAAAAAMAVLMVVSAAPAMADVSVGGGEFEVDDVSCDEFGLCVFFSGSDSGGDSTFSSPVGSFESDDGELTQNLSSPGTIGGSLSGGNSVGFSSGGSSGGSFEGGGIEIG